MVRDKYKSKEYFESFIANANKRLNKRWLKLENNMIKPERVKIVKQNMSGVYIKNVIARYSMGQDISSNLFYNDYEKSLTLMYENWEENLGKYVYSKRKKTIVLQQYVFSMYLGMLDRLSLAILLDIKPESFKLLINYIDRDNIKDFLLEFLISYYEGDRLPITEESYQEFFHINERLGRLKIIAKEESKEIAEEELKCFLEKEWYSSFKDTPLYNQHNNQHNTYAGYWCFAAAAIVKIKELDDSSFRENKYYPKDLV